MTGLETEKVMTVEHKNVRNGARTSVRQSKRNVAKSIKNTLYYGYVQRLTRPSYRESSLNRHEGGINNANP